MRTAVLAVSFGTTHLDALRADIVPVEEALADAFPGCPVYRAFTSGVVRRRLREIYRLHEREIVRGYDLVVVSRVRACAADYHQLESAFLSACAKLGLLTEGDGGV